MEGGSEEGKEGRRTGRGEGGLDKCTEGGGSIGMLTQENRLGNVDHLVLS